MNSEQWIMLIIILLIIFLLLLNFGWFKPNRIPSDKEFFTAINPNTGEMVIPSDVGVLIESNENGQAIRICGSGSAQAPGLGTSANQVQIYTNGNPTAAFDTTGFYTKGSINNVNLWSQGNQSLVLNATHTSGAVYNGSGVANTGLGWNAMSSVTTGGQNTAFGSSALNKNTNGVGNVAMGSDSLKNLSDSSGNYNTAVGYLAGKGSNSCSGGGNEAFGAGSLTNFTSGSNNSAIGSNSLNALTTGSNNIALGQAAGGTILTTGSNNVYLGASTVPSSATVSNETVIGAGTTGLGNGTLNIMNLIKVDNTLFNYTIGGTTTTDPLKGKYNVFMGNSAGMKLTTGEQTSGFGQGALGSCTSGTYNSAFGTNSLLKLTTGNYNTGLGHFAGRNLTTGSNNVYIGRESVASSETATNEIVIGGGSPSDTSGNWGKGSNTVLLGNNSTVETYLKGNVNCATIMINGHKISCNGTTIMLGQNSGDVTKMGGYNTGMGYQSLQSSTGTQNTGFGQATLYQCTSGSYNTAIGTTAGGGLATGSKNIYIGQGAGASGTAVENEIVIGTQATGRGSNTVSIGTSSTLVNYYYGSLSPATSSVSIGNGAMGSNDAFNTAVGCGSLKVNSTGSENTAIGNGVLLNNTSGSDNTVMGSNAGQKNTTGHSNTFIGIQSAFSNTTGTNNAFFGKNAGYWSLNADGNTAIGSGALGSGGTGYSTGNYNTALGYCAGWTAGAGNIPLTNGPNIYIGANARASSGGVENEIVIGTNTNGNGSNTVTIGNSSTTHTYLNGQLSCSGLSSDLNVFASSFYLGGNVKTGTNYFRLISVLGHNWHDFKGNMYWRESDTENIRMILEPNGYLTVKGGMSSEGSVYITSSTTTEGSGPLRLNNTNGAPVAWTLGPNSSGKFIIYNPLSVGVFITNNGTSWSSNSDARLKSNINSLNDNLSKILQLRPVSYHMKSDVTQQTQFGLIAQEVQPIIPEIVHQNDDYLSITYTELIPFLIGSIQEQQIQIQTQQIQIQTLEERLLQQDLQLQQQRDQIQFILSKLR